ncbi:MAG: DUF4388 domain-containing protein [Deltaproteobacteria bacterium]|nr:DUF4388 domain-containing protein [Deltaproteobacteria bacterium]
MGNEKKDDIEKALQGEEETSAEESLLDSGVAPKPVTNDPVQEALAMAESVAPEASSLTYSRPPENDEIGEAISLMQVIDRVEQRLVPSYGQSDLMQQSMPEELDVLDIEAELGRPDEPEAEDEAAEDEAAEDEAAEDEAAEDEAVEVRDDEIVEEGADSFSEDESSVTLDCETEIVSHARTSEDQDLGLHFQEGYRRNGDLAEDPLWTLLVAAFVDRLSGVLVLSGPHNERKIFLDQGEVVIATSTAREDRLVELLYREGRLSDEDYGKAALAVGTSGRRIGAILVERGLISSRELFPLVRHHYETIVLDSFGWREGAWRYRSDESIPGERILLDTAMPTLVVEGIRSRALPKDIDTVVPPGCRPLETPSGICKIEDAGLLPEEVAICHACDGTATVEQLARRFGFPAQDLCELMAGLVVLGLLHVEDMGAEQPSEGSPVLTGRRKLEHGFRVDRSRIADKMEQVKEGTYFAILGVSKDASGYEIRKAYRALSGQFAMERFAIPELQELQEDVRVILHVVGEAYEVLRNPASREAYRQAVKEEL